MRAGVVIPADSIAGPHSRRRKLCDVERPALRPCEDVRRCRAAAAGSRARRAPLSSVEPHASSACVFVPLTVSTRASAVDVSPLHVRPLRRP